MSRTLAHIAVSGGIAVGKTTLVRRLGALLAQCTTLVEYPEDNPYLTDFYADMPRWAFHSRISMLAMFASRYRALHDYATTSRIILMDRCIHELITFAELQHSSRNLSDRDFTIYRTLYDSIVALVPPLDVVIYLDCDPEVSLQRALARGRPFELALTVEYIAAVAQRYDSWLRTLPASTLVLRYDSGGDVDIASVSAAAIENHLKSRADIG